MPTSGDFVLHGGNTAFANRQKLLFDKLSNAEKECNKNVAKTSCIDVDMITADSNRFHQAPRIGQKRKIETKRFRGKESIFKRPEGPAPRTNFRSIPDHRRNPHKWVKYSLDDVSNDDMTDQSNTQAALSFLKELKARRFMEQAHKSEEEMDIDEPESSKSNVIFKARKIKVNSQIEFKKHNEEVEMPGSSVVVDHDNKPIFRSSKVIMPEYVVGQKQKKKSKKEKLPVKIDRANQLKLDHLEEIDDEEN